MGEMDELRQRVSALESQMTELRASHGQTQNEARRAADLFAMVDRDVADLGAAVRGQARVLQALRETQIEQGEILRQHGEILGRHGEALEHIKQDHGAKLERIVGMLTTLVGDEKV